MENLDDNWCWAVTPPFLNIGWENEQAFFDNTTLAETNEYYTPVKYYQWRINFFADFQAYLQSQLFIERLYFNEFSIYIPKFRTNGFTSFIVNGDLEVCGGLGWENEHIEFLVEMSMKFHDCYKIILTDICEYNKSWRSRNAKWLDECDLSNDSLI